MSQDPKDPKEVLNNWLPTPSQKKKHKASSNGKFKSLYEWLKTHEFSHQDKIRSGIELQKLIRYMVVNSPFKTELIEDNIISTLNLKEKEADLLCKLFDPSGDPKLFTVIYREVKGNVNLDSEKWPATLNKINDIGAGLRIRYPNSKIDVGFLCPAWLHSGDNVEGFNDFLHTFGYDELTFDEFISFGQDVGSKIRSVF